jgi:mono/diheme cytochrome c family protein
MRLDRSKAVFALAVLGAALSPARAVSQTPSPGPWEAPPEARQLQNPMKTDGKTVERGKKLFQRLCTPCHGESGSGDGTMAKAMGYKPANLTLERLNRLADGEIFWKISKGRPPMPTFEKQVSERERWDLVSYVRTLVRQAP